MNKVNPGKILSPSLCSCPQEINFFDQYVSHPTHALRSPGSHSSHPGGTGRSSRRVHLAQAVNPEVSDPCSHQHASVARASAHRAAHTPAALSRPPWYWRVLVSSDLSHNAVVTRIGRAGNITHTHIE